MKRILLCSSLLALFANHAIAEGIYIAGKLGGSNGEANSIKTTSRYTIPTASVTPTDKDFTDNVFAWGGAVGYEYNQWMTPLRMEVEYLYRNHYRYDTGFPSYSKSELEFSSVVDNQTVLANFYVDVPVTKMLKFFVGGGLGQAINTSNSKEQGTFLVAGQDLKGEIDNYNFSWMATAGMTVQPLKWLNIDLSYRYSDLGDISMRTGEADGSQRQLNTTSFAAQELFLGFRLNVPGMIKRQQYKKAHPYMDK